MPVISAMSAPYLHDEGAAFAHLESILWPEGPVCPHCGSISGKHYDLRKTRVGLRKCSDCRKQFTVKIGTVFESDRCIRCSKRSISFARQRRELARISFTEFSAFNITARGF